MKPLIEKLHFKLSSIVIPKINHCILSLYHNRFGDTINVQQLVQSEQLLKH